MQGVSCMSNLLDYYNNKQIERLSVGKTFPGFRAGDSVQVTLRIVDSGSERLQKFLGLCIKRKNRGLNSSFVLRKVDKNGGSVERLFHLYSPVIKEIEVKRYGAVRRAKIYYIRNVFGKAAKIKERRKVISNRN